MRSSKTKKIEIGPDEIHDSILVTRLINYVMQKGKKSLAQKIVYKAIEDLQKETKTKGIVALEKALDNVKPKLEVRSRRVGGANFQVPVVVQESRQESLAIRWLIGSARESRKNVPFWKSLSRELINAYKNEGASVKKKEDSHKMAEANKAFAQFAQY